MYERLLVALDGSTTAEQVLDHAAALAAAFGSTVTLLRATISAETLLAETATPENIGDITPIVDPTPIVEADQESATEYLKAVSARLTARDVQVTIEEPEGPPADAIVQRAQELGASLILMTTHGRSGLRRIVFGSVADSVLRHAPCPVLLVRVREEKGD